MVAAEELLRFVTAARDAGAAVLLSTHVIDEAQRVCDRVVVLLEGEKAAEGAPAEVAEGLGVGSLRDAFRALVQGRRG